MNINWRVRLKSGSFWLGIGSAVVAALFAILQLCGVELNVTQDQILHTLTLILMIPASVGIISDPTTRGLSDSARVMTYDRPAENIAGKGKK